MLDAICSISIAKSKTFEPNDKIYFDVLDSQQFQDFSKIITTYTWSPHIWRDGKRHGSRWLSANFIALDFDSGFPLLETIKICENENLTFLIGTTKSHQVEKISPSGKVSPPVDRYRLAILTDGPIDNAETYRNTMDYFTAIFPMIDKSCKDPGRYFFPCREIVAMRAGKLQPWLPVSEEERTRREESRRRYEEYLAENRGSGIIPPQILSDLRKEEHPIGTRHNTCYRIGAELAKLGFPEQYIIDLVLDSSLKDIGRADAERAVRNGYSKARGQYPEWWEI